MTLPHKLHGIPASILILFAGAFQLVTDSLAATPQTNSPSAIHRFAAVAEIKFRGTSTLHNFEGRVMSQPFDLLLSSNTWSAKADVFGGRMTTFNGRRDRGMWTMLSTKAHPLLSGSVLDAARPPTAGTNVTLSLSIHGTKLDLPVTITEWSETTNDVRFRAAWEVSLKQYSLKPPSVLGLIRVGDTVHLEAQVTAVKPAATPNPHTSDGAAITNQ